MANEFMLKWRIAEEQKEQLSYSYNKLQEEGIITTERVDKGSREGYNAAHQTLQADYCARDRESKE